MNTCQDRDGLIRQNLKLVHACANRFRGKGMEYEDLYSAGCVGLVKAADGYRPELGFAFSTYAVPVILGEIRRLFRESGTVKVSRGAKEKARQLLLLREEWYARTGKEPALSEIAGQAGIEVFEAAQLLAAVQAPLSLTAPEEQDERQTDLLQDSGEGELLDRLSLEKALEELPPRDRELISCRYYEGLTQSVTAARLGMSQVQVSRREKAILTWLRGEMG